MNQNSDDDTDIREQAAAPGGVRGQYYERYMQGTNIVLLAPDIAEAFHDSETVNSALRQYLAEHGNHSSQTSWLNLSERARWSRLR